MAEHLTKAVIHTINMKIYQTYLTNTIQAVSELWDRKLLEDKATRKLLIGET